MFRLLRSLVAVSVVIIPFVPATALSADGWETLSDRDLSVAAGSPLDFSGLVEAGPAGKHSWATVLPDGHIGFERRSIAQRFLCASLGFSELNGGVPDKAGSERLVRQLTRTGYNLVRFHFVDAHLMTNRSKNFDFNPEQLDRLHFLLARLKAAGVYWIVDGMTSDNAAWGDVKPNRWTKKHRARMDVLAGPKGFAHWATLVERLWGTENPYTGIAPLKDPAMLGIILVNEGSFFYLANAYGKRYPPVAGHGKYYPTELTPRFRDWLKARYGTDASLRAAWGGGLKKEESLAGVVEMPVTIDGRAPRDIDFAQFIVDLESEGYRAMDAKVRELGFKGLTTAFDNWSFLGADTTRSALQWVDMHNYPMLHSRFGQPGSKLAQWSLHKNAAHYVRELETARQWGKPFTVTEYAQPFWNRWRHESAALVPAVAAHQGWDAICQFAEMPIQFDYNASPFVRMQAIYPFGVGADPIARGAERLAAMLYLRGDVAGSHSRIRLHIDSEKALARSGGREQVPEVISQLGLIAPIGLDFRPLPNRTKPGELSIDLTGAQPFLLGKLQNSLVRAGLDLRSDGAKALRDAGLIDSKNVSRPENRLFQSDTGQILIDSAGNRIEVVTERTVALVLRGGDASAGVFSVRTASGPALFAISSLDSKPIPQSRRLLLWILTDAINTGMTFADAERTTIKTLGKLPPQVQTVSATLRIAAEENRSLKAWPLTLAGVRREAIPLNRLDGAIELHVDTATLPDGPAIFFEIAAD